MAVLRMISTVMGRMVLKIRWSHITYTWKVKIFKTLVTQTLNLDIERILPEVSKCNGRFEGRLPHQVEGLVDNLQLDVVKTVSYQVPAVVLVPDSHGN